MPTGGPIGSAYRDAVLRSRAVGYKLTAEGRERMLDGFARMLFRIANAEIEDGAITTDRALALERQTRALLASFEREWAGTVNATTGGTLRETMRIHQATLEELAPSAGALRVDFDRIPPVVSQILAHTRKADSFRSLLRYRLEDVTGNVDRILRGAVARGAPGGQTAVDIARLLAGDSPELQANLRKITGRIRATTLGKRLSTPVSRIDLERYGISAADVPAMRTLLNDARRIAVSETANTMREANAAALTLSPVVKGAKWQTSSRHAHVSSTPDICDVYATANRYGMGEGIWPPDVWPISHPYCMCYQAGPIEWREPSEWDKPKEKLQSYHDPSLKKKLRAMAEASGRTKEWADRIHDQFMAQTRELNRASMLGGATRKARATKPKPKAAPKPAPAPKPEPAGLTPMTRTRGEVDDALTALFSRDPAGLATRDAVADAIADAMDAPAFGFSVTKQKRTPGSRWVFNDPDANVRGYYGVATWEGKIGLHPYITQGLESFAKQRAGGAGMYGIGQSAMQALKTLIHEVVHMRSPTRYTGRMSDALSYGTARAHRWLEEGMTEWQARMHVARSFYRRRHYDAVMEPVFRDAASYVRETNSIDWYARQFGEDAVDALWARTHGADRVAEWSDKVIPWLKGRAELLGSAHEDLRKQVLDWIDRYQYRPGDLVEESHRFYLLEQGGPSIINAWREMLDPG